MQSVLMKVLGAEKSFIVHSTLDSDSGCIGLSRFVMSDILWFGTHASQVTLKWRDMSVMTFHITVKFTVCPTVCSGAH